MVEPNDIHLEAEKQPIETKTPLSGEETDDVLLDAQAAQVNAGALKLAKDGHVSQTLIHKGIATNHANASQTILLPQPTSSAHDPLNWSWRKKHLMLFIVAFTGFLADFTSAGGVPLIQVQGLYWNLDPNVVNYAGNLNVAFLGIGGIFWAVVSSCWGRLPVMFWATLLGAVCVLVSAVTTSFQVYYAFRTLTGFFLVSYQIVGLASVKDMFFFHEHARKIGIWVVFFIVSPYLSPLFAYFILGGTGGNSPIGGDWRAVLWLVFAIVCLDLVLIVVFADETFYNRAISPEAQPSRGSRIMRLLGVWQLKNKSYFPSAWQSCVRLVSLLAKPILIPGLLYYMLVFMWAIGINITSSILFLTPPPAGYGFAPLSVGYLYFTPIVGALIGEFFGHFFNDWIAKRYVRSHAGIFHPEARLPTTYVAGALMIPGLVAVGQALQFHLSVGIVVIGWGMYVCGVMVASVAISTYLLDAFPQRAAEVSGLINFARSIGGFQVGYYQMQWGTSMGFDKSFGIQAGFVAFASIIIIALQAFGRKLRGTKSV